MKRSGLKSWLLLTVLMVVTGCSEPPAPPEIQQALTQEQDLWRAGASVYAPDGYQKYLSALGSARDLFARERSRMVWFRDYQPISQAFSQVVGIGTGLQQEVEKAKLQQATEIADAACKEQKRIALLRELSETLKDRRLAMRKLTQADLRVQEAVRLGAADKGKEARQRLQDARIDVEAVIKTIKPLVSRYADRTQVAQWRALVEQAVSDSKRSGSDLIVVNKIERELRLYRKGNLVKTFDAGFGFNFLADKLYSGDKATPEGHYRVIKKLDQSRYYKALLIDYPNEEDRRRFALAKRKQQIPRNAGIGNLIEIHGGGGDNSMTNGCISLKDNHIEDLFRQVDVGTPVVIVGTVDYDNIISSALRGLN